MKNPTVMILNLPSPPQMDVERDYAGGYGTAGTVRRRGYGHSRDVVFPVFMPYLATAAQRRGWTLEIVDGQALRLDGDAVTPAVAARQPDVVVSLVSLPSMPGDLALLRRVKARVPGCVVVAVGTTARVLGDEMLASGGVDVVIRAEYPFYGEPIARLVHAWQAGSLPADRIIRRGTGGAAESLDDLDLEVYHRFPIGRYRCRFQGMRGELVNYFPILSSKGCPYGCGYCPYPLGFGRRIAYKSPDRLVDEMAFLNRTFGVRAFLFRDQVFTADRERVNRLCDLILSRGLDVQWLFETRVDMVPEDLLKKVRRAGCNRIHYGIETGDRDLLRDAGRPGVDARVAIDTFHRTAALGIRMVAHVIVGLPGETRQSLENTYALLGTLDPDNTSWNFATPYPGTRLCEIARRQGLILTRDWTRYSTNQVVMRTRALSGPQLSAIVQRLVKRDRRRKAIRRLGRAFYSARDRQYVIRRSLGKLAAVVMRV